MIPLLSDMPEPPSLELSAYEDSLKVYRDWYSVMKRKNVSIARHFYN
jgi:hypothetical protein